MTICYVVIHLLERPKWHGGILEFPSFLYQGAKYAYARWKAQPDAWPLTLDEHRQIAEWDAQNPISKAAAFFNDSHSMSFKRKRQDDVDVGPVAERVKRMRLDDAEFRSSYRDALLHRSEPRAEEKKAFRASLRVAAPPVENKVSFSNRQQGTHPRSFRNNVKFKMPYPSRRRSRRASSRMSWRRKAPSKRSNTY